jgi:hypothetical protein
VFRLLLHVWLGQGRSRSVVHFCDSDTLKASFLFEPGQAISARKYAVCGPGRISHWSVGPTDSTPTDVHRKVWVVEVQNSLSSAHLQQNWRTQCFTYWSKSFQIPYNSSLHLGRRRNRNMWFTELALGALVSLAVSTHRCRQLLEPSLRPSVTTQQFSNNCERAEDIL